jgi:ATP-dependent Clp protease adaptor protein ClpS
VIALPSERAVPICWVAEGRRANSYSRVGLTASVGVAPERLCDRPVGGRSAGRLMDLITMSDNDKRGGGTTEGPNTGVVVKARPKTRKPAMYKVLMLNDDYTPMEFVVHVLERFFQKNREEATRIMLHVHRRGVGVCGVFTYEVAETKVTQVMDLARQNQHPLQCTIEKE